ncbi:extensin family protein [Breoghania sp.]|uniref:extensin-like domain-containing protein n=1 Tax=Breoghania sp. TaxID=2065378 RepID=UPI002AA894D8|nr:extensin family protein [Breoghania sp.]
MFFAKAVLLAALVLLSGEGEGLAASQGRGGVASPSLGQAMEERAALKSDETTPDVSAVPRERPRTPKAEAVPEAAPASRSDPDRLPPPKPEKADDLFARAAPDAPDGQPERPVVCTLTGAVTERAGQPLPDVPACQIPVPVEVSAVGEGGDIALTPAATLDCALAGSFAAWMREVVAPAALEHLGFPVSGVRIAASFHCRRRNNLPDGKLSEHAKGNAVDISAFRLADGREVSVEEGWKGEGAEKAFLLSVRKAACDRFLTVLSPEGDAYHQDHLHLDQGCHGKTCTYRICS